MFLAPVREQVARDPYSCLEIIESAATSATWSGGSLQPPVLAFLSRQAASSAL